MAKIKNAESNKVLNGTSGKDTIQNGGYDSGNGGVYLGGSSVSIDALAGNDYIYNKGEYVSINAGDGDDWIENRGSKVTVNAGEGSDTISNSGSFSVKLNCGAGDDSIGNSGSNVTISGGKGNDKIKSCYGNCVSINAGDGNNYVFNDGYDDGGNDLTITTGKGNDTIENSYGSYGKISAGAGDDSVDNYHSHESFLDGGAGSDTLRNSGDRVTLTGGAGDDLIVLSNGAENAMIVYNDGDGNDKVKGFNEDDTLSIIGGSYSSAVSGDDIIVTVGDGKITLVGAAGWSVINIDGKKKSSNPKLITLTEGNDTYSNSLEGATINALGGNDSIENYSSEVSINAGDGKDDIDNDGGSNVTINAGKGNDWIQNEGGKNVSLVGGAGNDEIFNQARGDLNDETGDWEVTSSPDNATISAGTGDDFVYNSGDDVSINAGTGDDTVYNNGNDVSINAGAGNDYIYNYWYIDSVTINAGNGNDTLEMHSDGGKMVTGGAGSDIFIFYYDSDDSYGTDYITDYSEEDTIQFDNVAVSKVSTNDSGSVIFKVGKNKLVVKNAADKVVTYIDSDGTTKTFGGSAADKWKLDGTTATYGSLTVKGVTSLGGLSLSGKILTVSAESLGTNKVTISDGYTLALGSDVSSASTKKSWTLKSSTATYKQTTSAGYELDDNEIIYSKKSSKTLVTVKGVTSTDGLKVSGKTVTVSAESLGTNKVTISDGYTLKLGDVDKTSTKKSWTLKNSTATYKQTTTAGYSLENNEIIYSKKSSKTLATVKGVNDKSGLKVSGKTIKLSGDALSKKVTVSGDYVFDFASDFKNATITGSSSNDTIIARGKNIFVTGGAGSDIFALKPTVANVISDYDSTDKISLLSGAADFSVSGGDLLINGKVTLKGAAEKIVTYIEDGAEKIFAAPAPYNEAVTLAANYAEDTFTANATLVTIDASAVLQPLEIFGNKKANVITGSDEDDYIDGGTGADKIFGRDGNDTLIGGAGNDSLSGGAGDDSLWGSAGTDTLRGGDGSDIFVYKAGDGKIIVEDFDDAWDKIRVLSGSVDVPESDGKDVTFAVDDGQIIVKGGANKYIPIYLGEGNKNIVQKYIPRS